MYIYYITYIYCLTRTAPLASFSFAILFKGQILTYMLSHIGHSSAHCTGFLVSKGSSRPIQKRSSGVPTLSAHQALLVFLEFTAVTETFDMTYT